MIWKINKPNVGDTRTKFKFAWLPVTITYQGEPHKLWLEAFEIVERYEYSPYGYSDGSFGSYSWKELPDTRTKCTRY